MNLHVPQSYSSSVELQELAAVPYQIISPAKNAALIQLVQDTLLGYYVVTHDDIYIDKRDMMNILMGVPNFSGVLPKPAKVEDKKQYWTGKQLVSIGLPRINMNTGKVIIENGELIKGRINKGASNRIIQIVYNDFGPKVCQEYLDNIQNIVTRFLVKHGFSIGVSDLIISDGIRRQIQDIIVDGKKQVLELEKKIHLNILTDIKRNVHDTFENKTLEILNKTTKQIEDMYKKQLKDDNRAILMKDAGSKGKDMNIRQMSTHLGQQKVQGKRVPIGYTDRTLPHYYRYDSDVISRGFVENSFMDGLTPQESFFHAMGGREGLIDTAVKTSESGYIQRKLIKAMEDLKVFHDSTVRNASGDIVQFLYGYDGIDASGGIEGNHLELATDEYAQLKEKFQFKKNENWETFMSKSAIKKMKQTKNWHKKLDDYFNMLMSERDRLFEVFNYTSNANMEYLKCPFNAERIISNTIQTLKIREDGLSDLSPIDVIEAVEGLCNNLTINDFSNFNFNLTVKTKLSPKQVICKYRLTKLGLAHVINVITMKFNESIVQAGEMVGMLAAQSLGETSTQLTLNSIIGEEKILIQEDGMNKVVEIGQWIDSKLKQNRDKIQHIPKNRTQYLELKEKVLIPSCDMDGKTGWHELTAVTKHLPVGDLVKITTKSGRSVTATQSKSFLVYDNKTDKLIDIEGSNVKVGDKVPVIFQINNSKQLDKNDKIYETTKNNTFSDTILDNIVDIKYINNNDENGNIINVYDVTVPTTLNFCIDSGLVLRDTFHSAGSGATVTTQGVPRLRELLSNTKNMSTPSSTLFLDEESRYSLDRALEVKYNIEITTIRDIVVSCSIYNDPDNKFNSIIEEDKNILEIYKVFHEIDENCRDMKANPWVLRFKFNRSKMMERKISMDNIYQVITQSYSNAVCTYSDDNSNDLIFRIRLDFVASNEKSDDDIKLLKKVENKILDLVVKGVDNIDGSHISDYNISLVKDELGNYVTKSERQLTTDGSNLVELVNVNNVNSNRCFSNDINEIYYLYGIEAARNVLYNEFNMIFSSEEVNFRHIAMLCDIMTNQGIIMSIDRHGINRGTNGPLAKCSFEEAVDQLQKAAIHGDRDNLSGVSANVMMGQLPPSGTGDSTLILDELKLIETQDVDNPEDELDIDEILNVSDYCQENVGITFNINKIKKKNINVKNIPKVIPE
jgi:DNA-directed RNA polymerase beta' subunit